MMSAEEFDEVTQVLRDRCGRWSIVHLSDGRKLRVFDIAWGRDIGEGSDHITTNISPGPADAHTVDIFSTLEVIRVVDESNQVLFRRGTSPA